MQTDDEIKEPIEWIPAVELDAGTGTMTTYGNRGVTMIDPTESITTTTEPDETEEDADDENDEDYEPTPKREPDALDRFLDRLSRVKNIGFYMSLGISVVLYLVEGNVLLSLGLGFVCGYAIKWYLLMDDDRRARTKLL